MYFFDIYSKWFLKFEIRYAQRVTAFLFGNKQHLFFENYESGLSITENITFEINDQ